MRKQILFVIFFFVVLGVILYFIYTKFPPEEENLFNVSVSAIYNGKFVETGITLIDDDETFERDILGYELFRVSGLITITNRNLENQSFYQETKTYNISEDRRIDIELEEPSYVDINVIDNESLFVILKSECFKEVDFCLKGSVNYMFLEAENYTKSDKIPGFENYDVCYDGQFSLKNSNSTIKINYLEFQKPTENDYINLSIKDLAGNNQTFKIK